MLQRHLKIEPQSAVRIQPLKSLPRVAEAVMVRPLQLLVSFSFSFNALCCQVMKILYHKVIPFFVCRQKVKKKKIFSLHSSTGCMLRAITLWPVWPDALMSFSYPVLKVWARTIKIYVFNHFTIITDYCVFLFSGKEEFVLTVLKPEQQQDDEMFFLSSSLLKKTDVQV